jgi:hypothetical protein
MQVKLTNSSYTETLIVYILVYTGFHFILCLVQTGFIVLLENMCTCTCTKDSWIHVFIPPATKLEGVYWFHHVRPSVDKSYVVR